MKPTKKPVLVVVKGGDRVGEPVPTYLAEIHGKASFKLPRVAQYIRFVKNEDNEFFDQQVILLCGAKIQTECGFWKSLQTGKVYSEGVTSYDKNKGALVIKNMGPGDFGMYSSAGVGGKFYNVQEKPASG
ncbi:hypothetical protein B9Z55_020698 [Caenorhabditis nigoni]|uniref:Uncharacterized protein n=1 Tax=Caenorhabditis nigoni TaxID=1611254 RepID=A0A2G5TNX2_9PELO|nr:hypothetical protein B9Z55_020698 [Caenorhabditis nigoni]